MKVLEIDIQLLGFNFGLEKIVFLNRFFIVMKITVMFRFFVGNIFSLLFIEIVFLENQRNKLKNRYKNISLIFYELENYIDKIILLNYYGCF